MFIWYECLFDERVHRLKTQMFSPVANMQKPLLPCPRNPFIFLSIRNISLNIKDNCYLIFNSLTWQIFPYLDSNSVRREKWFCPDLGAYVTQASLED